MSSLDRKVQIKIKKIVKYTNEKVPITVLPKMHNIFKLKKIVENIFYKPQYDTSCDVRNS